MKDVSDSLKSDSEILEMFLKNEVNPKAITIYKRTYFLGTHEDFIQKMPEKEVANYITIDCDNDTVFVDADYVFVRAWFNISSEEMSIVFTHDKGTFNAQLNSLKIIFKGQEYKFKTGKELFDFVSKDHLFNIHYTSPKTE